MFEITNALTKLLATLTLLGHIGLAGFLLLLLIRKFTRQSFRPFEWLLAWTKDNAILFVFLIALTGTALSLYYSDIAKLPPCDLCWWQRVFLYPQLFIFGLALLIKDKKVAIYGILLSIFGLIVAAWQYIGQLNQMFWQVNTLTAPCSTEVVSCTDYYFFEYGYITMPLMSVTAFAFILLTLLIHRYYKKG